MNRKKIRNILIVVVFVLIIVIVGYFVLIKKTFKVNQTPNSDQTNITQTQVPKYNNAEYGFSFSLPSSWIGYSIIVNNWDGNMIDGKSSKSTKGPEILIRHPLWTKDVPRQDIPIMIFTILQWDLIQQEKLSVGAAPIGPSELGRNAKYVFAIPARYNFAYPVGFEEVEKILKDKSFSIL